MIGYNEYQEAEHLLCLLLASREKLKAFNLTDEEITARGSDVISWYAELARWAMEARDSGRYALCFQSADQVQRKPYDLLARLPLKPEETEAAPLQDDLLTGLPDAEKTKAKRLYHRLLCIQPMRMLLSRLLQLEAALKRRGAAQQEELIRLIARHGFRDTIPLTQERRSRQSLDLRDNDFTILDRLMDNWDKPLRREEWFVVPQTLIHSSACAQSLMTAAILRRHQDAGAEKTPYQTIPGGHTSLGVYHAGAPEQFFRAVIRDQERCARPRRLMRIRGYAGMQLLQLTDETVRNFRRGGNAAELLQEEAFCARDDGGRGIFNQLAMQVEECSALSDAMCLELFQKGRYLPEEERLRALAELRRGVQQVFAQQKLPGGVAGEMKRVVNRSGNLAHRAVGLLLAHAVGDRELACLPCPNGQPPQNLLDSLTELEKSESACKRFIDDVNGMEEQETKLDLRFTADEPRRLWALRSAEAQMALQTQWLAEAADAMAEDRLAELSAPPFSCVELEDVCRAGLHHFLLLGRSVGTGAGPGGFTLAVSQRGARPKDVYFRLLCIWCVLTCNGGQDVFLVPDENSPEKISFRTGKASIPFVDVFAGTDTGIRAAQLTPVGLRGFLQQTVGSRLKIVDAGDGRFRVSVSRARPRG